MQSMAGLFGGGMGAGTAPMSNNMAGQDGAPAANPMNNMMQQMMSNPAMMQQSMAMAQQMFGGGAGYGSADVPQLATNQEQAASPSPAPNPMAGMMQQMMNNPAMMQHSMAMMN